MRDPAGTIYKHYTNRELLDLIREKAPLNIFLFLLVFILNIVRGDPVGDSIFGGIVISAVFSPMIRWVIGEFPWVSAKVKRSRAALVMAAELLKLRQRKRNNMGLRFKAAWRFKPPPDNRWQNQTIPPGALDDFHRLIVRTATQGPRQEILEHFKGFFCAVVGHAHVWSSDEGWADTDLHQYMGQAADNAPLFLEAFYDACDTISRVNEHYSAPNTEMINAICEKHRIGYKLNPPDLILCEAETLAVTDRHAAGTEPEVLAATSDVLGPASNTVKSRPLRVFLCHSRDDKPAVRELYRRLRSDEIAPWLDEEDILPGRDWRQEIPKAVRSSDVVIVCLSQGAASKRGYIQKEIRYALDVADEQPEETIFIIPLRLEECDVPERLSRWQWVNYYEGRGHERLLLALRASAEKLQSRNHH